jgi:hypothetical protein
MVDGKWVTADEWLEECGHLEPVDDNRYTGRNYRLFGLIADGVRESFPFSVPIKGLPDDVSPEVKKASDDWDSDGHSHSYLTKTEMLILQDRIENEQITVKGMKSAEGWKKYQDSVASGKPDYDLIFPFCAWTTMEGHVKFETQIPASFMMGECLKELISTLDDVDGDDQRIVFFFDN